METTHKHTNWLHMAVPVVEILAALLLIAGYAINYRRQTVPVVPVVPIVPVVRAEGTQPTAGTAWLPADTAMTQADDDMIRLMQCMAAKKSEDVDIFKLADTSPPEPDVPTSVKIGFIHYEIRWRTQKQMPEYFGYSSYEDSKILLNTEMPHDLRRETLLHEIMHMCVEIRNRSGGLSYPTPDEDKYIETISPALMEVLRDNPELVKWLQK